MSIVKNHTKHSPTTLSGSSYDDKIIKKNIPSIIVSLAEEQSLVDMESSLRTRYSNELRSKKQQIYS